MIKAVILVTGRVAGQACSILINIAADPVVFLIGFGVDVAVDAGKRGIVTVVVVTVGTFHPFPFVGSGINRKM
jgi:hypothetical protein